MTLKQFVARGILFLVMGTIAFSLICSFTAMVLSAIHGNQNAIDLFKAIGIFLGIVCFFGVLHWAINNAK